MYKSAEIERFMREHLKQRFPTLNVVYRKRFYARLFGPVLQGLIVGVGKGGYIRVLPVMYVLGERIDEEELSPSLSLEITDRKTWHLAESTPLDAAFAKEIHSRIEKSPVLNLSSAATSTSVEQDIRWFARDPVDWSAALSLAFFNIIRGVRGARSDLSNAFERFRNQSRLATNKPLYDYEVLLCERFKELEARLDSADCIALCRADAENHARVLKLPPLVWPAEWPTSVPTWPSQPTSTLGNKLRGFLGKRS